MSADYEIPPPVGLRPYAIGLLFCHGLAISTTLFRLAYRYRRRQMQWDDFWVAVALFCDIEVLVVWVTLLVVDIRHATSVSLSYLIWSAYYFSPTLIWACRMSIMVTVVRILPPGRTRTISKASCWGFGVIWLIVIIQTTFICGTPVPAIPICASKSTPILQMIANAIGSLWLVGWPAYILIRIRYNVVRMSQMKVPSTHHRLLLACFSTDILLLGVNTSHSVYLFVVDILLWQITGHLEVTMSLFLCNMLVLVTYIYRLFCEPLGSSYATSQSRTPVHGSQIISTGGRMGHTFRRSQREPTQVYTSTQIYTLTEYPTAAPGVPSKERRVSVDTLEHSLSFKKQDDLLPREKV